MPVFALSSFEGRDAGLFFFLMILKGGMTVRSPILLKYGRSVNIFNINIAMKGIVMKKLTLFFVFFFVCGFALTGRAENAMEGALGWQLKAYPKISEDFMDDFEVENKNYMQRYERLRLQSIELSKRYDKIKAEIGVKEQSIDQLKEMSKKLAESRQELQAQYDELEDIFLIQQEETNRLKQAAETGKVMFYHKLVEFYEEEDKMLTEALAAEDDAVNDKIGLLKDRQEKVRDEIKKLKELIVEEEL